MTTLSLRARKGADHPSDEESYFAAGTTRSFDFSVFIGRFNFFHNGHLHCVRRGLEVAHHLIVLIGSSKQARSQRNPLNWEEVRGNILGALSDEERSRVVVLPLVDRYNDTVWMYDVQAAVTGVVAQHHRPADGSDPRICLVGHTKDKTSYYLRMFPQWDSVAVDNCEGLSSTPIRADYFADAEAALVKWADKLPPNVVNFLSEFAGSETYDELAEEAAYIRNYKARWATAPYAPTFVTADAVVIQSGHILLIERRAMPGQGLLALPGGFVDPSERIRDAMIRELVEETRIKVPRAVVEGSIKAEKVFDDPHRSARGRTITTAFLVQLKPTGEGLPRVRGGDDAMSAFWMPIAKVDPERMFEDHWYIIQTMLGYAGR